MKIGEKAVIGVNKNSPPAKAGRLSPDQNWAILIFFRQTLSASCVLSYDEKPKPYGHSQFPFFCGNHEPIYGDGDAVEMYVS